MEKQSKQYLRIISAILFIVLAGNLIVLDISAIRSRTLSYPLFVSNLTKVSVTPTPNDTSCKGDCVQEIYTAIKNATASSSVRAKPQETIGDQGEKEYYVSFGTGDNATDDWVDVPGLQAYIDTTKYSTIVSARFEASILIVNGNQKAYARLFNVTDKHPVWFSEVSLEGGEAKLLISDPITLDPGNKLYQVQMKTQLKAPTKLLSSRVHIITK